MNAKLELLIPNDVRDKMEGTELSQKARARIVKIGHWLENHPKIPAYITITGYLGEFLTNQALHPEFGPVANFFSPAYFDVSPVEDQYSLNALQGITHTMFVAGGISTIYGYASQRAKELLVYPQLKDGEAKNPYPKMVLMVDKTNETSEGSTHGDFYNEFYRHLSANPDLFLKFVTKYGPACEIVPQNVPKPDDIPVIAYFRNSNPSNTDFLHHTVKAKRSSALISILMSRSHTVWDSKFQPTPEEIALMENMNNTVTDTLQAGKIPKIIITNDIIIPTFGVFDAQSGEIRYEHPTANQYFTEKGYKVFLAEQETMNDLIHSFKSKDYKKIVLMDDGSQAGDQIAIQWLADYNQWREKDPSLPEIIVVPEGELSKTLLEQEYDGIFLIGAEDAMVAQAANAILDKQTINQYRKVPMEVLMEGRGSADKLSRVEENGGNLHFIHENLAKQVVNYLLEN